MNNISQRQLEYNIQLVKYENPKKKDIFDLTTIHSLLIDNNPKFIDLRQLIVEYNANQTQGKVNRPHLRRPFIQRLYKMLSELTRISKSQNQLIFLNRLHAWAFNSDQNTLDQLNNNTQNMSKLRPPTASTKSRPYSAYTQKTRPDSAIPTKQSIPSAKKSLLQNVQVRKAVMEKHPKVDFKQLKYGEKQFFLGNRTLHPEEERPKIKLKEYQRKVLYEEDLEEDKFKEFTQLKKESFERVKLQQIPMQQQVPLQQQKPVEGQPNLEQNAEGQQGQQGAVPVGQQQVNIDDLGVPGQDDQQGAEGGDAVQQEQVQVVDKLRPRLKVYGDALKSMNNQDHQKYARGMDKQFYQKNKLVRQVEQDQKMSQMMQQWAATKNRVKIQQRRRAQSARMMTRPTGFKFQKYHQKVESGSSKGGIFDLSQVRVPQTKSSTRPLTAFKGQSTKVYNQVLQNAIMTGKIDKHLVPKQGLNNINVELGQKLGVFAAKPKKRTFEQILRDAEERVNNEVMDQIEQVKQKLTNNGIAFGANKIYKSLSHHQPQLYDGQFVGQIIGQNMINNPFFKVAKKKKKKKKGKK